MKSVGIDIGTTSISAAVTDDGFGGMERSWTIANPGFLSPGHPWERLQDPEAIVASDRRLLDEILDTVPQVKTIGLTGQMHGIIYVDGAGKALGPLMTWQDMRGLQPLTDGGNLCGNIRARYGIKTYPGYGLVTHLHNVDAHAVPGDALGLATIADYLGMRLTGSVKPLLHSSNAASLGLYDLESHAWRRDILREYGEGGDLLPGIVNRFQPIGSYRGVPVAVAIGDNQASFLGSVRRSDEEILINMGTGGQVSLLCDRILEGEELETRPFNEGGYLAVGSSLCGGRAYALLARFFSACAEAFGSASADPYIVMARFLERPREADPMTVRTTFDGTREHPEARGGIGNLSTGNFTPWGLTRGVLEGMAGELLERYEAMRRALDARHRRIIASGNGLRRNPALQQIAAEKFRMEVRLSPNTEEAACGAAMAGLVAVGRMSWEKAVGFEKPEGSDKGR